MSDRNKEKYISNWLKFYSKQFNLIFVMLMAATFQVFLNESSSAGVAILPLIVFVFPALYSLACKNIELDNRVKELEEKLSKEDC